MTELIKRRLGRTELQVTALGCGTFQCTAEFGVPRTEADRILDRAFEAGINFFDTAAMYGYGESEEMVGSVLARHGRQGIYVSSKVGWMDRTVARYLGDEAYRSEDGLLRAIKHSFWLLRLDEVDVFMIHEPDWPLWGLDFQNGEGVVTRVLEQLKSEGLIGAIGLGSWYNEPLVSLTETGRFDVILVAGGYTLLHQPLLGRLLNTIKRNDLGLIVGGAFHQGIHELLEPQPASLQKMIDTGEYREGLNESWARKLLALYTIANQLGISLPELTIRFVLSNEDIHTHIAGARCVAHIDANIHSVLAGPLPSETINKILSL